MEWEGIKKPGLEAVKEIFKRQYEEELKSLSQLVGLLGLPVSAEELIKYSGLTISYYSVKGHEYMKLIGTLTGERAGKEEEWLMRKKGEEAERERRYRRKSVHLLNARKTEEKEIELGWLIHYWRRAKAIKKWLEEVEEKLSQE